MYASTSFTSPLIQDLNLYSRRLLLLHTSLNQSPNSTNATYTRNNTTASSYLEDHGNFDANVVMVLSVLLCALICSLGLNSIIRCALRCSNLVINDSSSRNHNNNNHHNNNNPSRMVNTGVRKKALKTFPTVSYSSELNLPCLDSECVICLSEFANGDRVRILPKCNHGFHIKCIDKWLSSHSSCPKCRQCLIETCQKIVGSSTQQPPVPETIVTIVPLGPEGLVRNYRGS